MFANRFHLGRPLLLFAMVFPLLLGCGEKDDPQPAAATGPKMELKARFAGTKHLGGQYTAYTVSSGVRTQIARVVVDTTGVVQNYGDVTTSLGNLPTGTKLLVRLDFTRLTTNAQAQALPNRLGTQPGTSFRQPTYMDVTVVSDGRTLGVIGLDNSYTIAPGQPNMTNEYEYTL